MIFEWDIEEISQLKKIIESWVKITQPRRNLLWGLFVKTNGVFTKTEKEMTCYAGKSFMQRPNGSEGRQDEWTEKEYSVDGEKISKTEYEWLRSRSTELDVPDGYIRIGNDTNNLLLAPEVPGRNDVLVVEGKEGNSRRGVWSYGEWFRGHPSECKISFGHKGTQRKLKRVTLNGKEIETLWVSLNLWKDSWKLAERALQEVGIKNPAKECIEALVDYYERKGLVPPK